MSFVKFTRGLFLRGQHFEICRVSGFANVHRIFKLGVQVFVVYIFNKSSLRCY